jgi:hypothetical protein
MLREFESGSWLGREHQGRGLGKEMREATLHLGFEGLGADARQQAHGRTTVHRSGSLVASATARKAPDERYVEERRRVVAIPDGDADWQQRLRERHRDTRLGTCAAALGL